MPIYREEVRAVICDLLEPEGITVVGGVMYEQIGPQNSEKMLRVSVGGALRRNHGRPCAEYGVSEPEELVVDATTNHRSSRLCARRGGMGRPICVGGV
jgi:hypothetical protein